MSEDSEVYTFYFKIAHTERTTNYSFDADITISDFISSAKIKLKNIFDLLWEENVIEIVEAGQNLSEAAPKLEPSERTLREVYGNKWKNTAFYLRYSNN